MRQAVCETCDVRGMSGRTCRHRYGFVRLFVYWRLTRVLVVCNVAMDTDCADGTMIGDQLMLFLLAEFGRVVKLDRRLPKLLASVRFLRARRAASEAREGIVR